MAFNLFDSLTEEEKQKLLNAIPAGQAKESSGLPEWMEKAQVASIDTRIRGEPLGMDAIVQSVKPKPKPVPKKPVIEDIDSEFPEDVPEAKTAPAMNPVVKDYLGKKYGFSDDLSDAALKDAQVSAARQRMVAGLSEAASTVGNAIAGRKDADHSFYDKLRVEAGQGVKDIVDRRKGQQEANAFERSQKQGEREDEQYERDSARLEREKDPNSAESILAQQLANKMMPSKDFTGMSAEKLNRALPSLTKIYEIEQRKLDRADARAERENARELTRQTRNEKLLDERGTQYGIARTADDAKKLKDAGEIKETFDRKLDEMIELRQKHNGGATLNREDVARGKQLAKDVLLAYKDMAKLGVLSKSDENILNAIIPTDPLQYNFSGIVGQDPTMHRLKKFREDSDKDFRTRIQNRLSPGQATQNPGNSNSSKPAWAK